MRAVSNVTITGNVFTFTDDAWGEIYAAVESLEATRNVTVSNNTFYNLRGLNTGLRFDDAATELLVRNNLWANCTTNQIMLPEGADYDAFFNNWREDAYLIDERIEEPHVQVLTEDPFVDAAAGDLHLADPTQPGEALQRDLGADPDGTERGGDGSWDRGAFEH
jgi:hypothetical protein